MCIRDRVYPEQAEVHILEDEAASRAYIEQMWAEAMEIYRSGRFKPAFSPAMQRYLKEHQRDFMPEDTNACLLYTSPEVGALRSPKAPCRRAVIFRSHGLLQIKQGTLHFPCAGCSQLPFCGLACWGHLAVQAVPSRQVS